MHKLNVAVVAALLAGAAVLGTLAAIRTTSLGAAHRSSANAAVQARAKQLDRFERALHAQLAHKPPALPRVPASRAAAAPAPTPRVVYRRPPAIVVVKHTSHHEDDGYEASEREGGDD